MKNFLSTRFRGPVLYCLALCGFVILSLIVLCFVTDMSALIRTAGSGAHNNKTFNAESFTLTNGLQVVVIPNHRAPVVTHMVWYKVGAIDEPQEETGLAHFVEHLMFKGTTEMPPGEFSRRVRALGGNDNAFTGHDYTAYHETVAVQHLETVMAMEADRMRNLIFPDADVLSERQVVIEERRERTENDPRSAFYEQMRAILFINHPYGNPVIGWMHEVDVLDRDHVRNFYDRWYAPNNAIVVISGDVTAEQVKPMAERLYGPVPSKSVPARRWTAVPPLQALPRLVLRHETIRQPVLMRIARAPSYGQNRQESLALQVLQSILDDGAATRLYKTLVVEQKVATGADFSYDSDNLSDSVITLSATPADGVSLEKLERAVDDCLRLLIQDGVTEEEVTEAKQRLRDEAVFARDSLTGPAMIFGQALATGATIDDVEYWPDNINAVTRDDVNNAARRYLDPDHYGTRPYVTGYILPAIEQAAP